MCSLIIQSTIQEGGPAIPSKFAARPSQVSQHSTWQRRCGHSYDGGGTATAVMAGAGAYVRPSPDEGGALAPLTPCSAIAPAQGSCQHFFLFFFFSLGYLWDLCLVEHEDKEREYADKSELDKHLIDHRLVLLVRVLLLGANYGKHMKKKGWLNRPNVSAVAMDCGFRGVGACGAGP